MKKRHWFGLLIFCGIVGALITLVRMREAKPEPVYKGKPISFWIRETARPQNSPETSFDNAKAACRALGTNSVPYLVKALNRRETLLSDLYERGYSKLPRRLKQQLLPPVGIPQQRCRAAQLLAELGPKATAAVPDLVMAMKLSDVNLTGGPAVFALMRIGHSAKAAVPDLIATLKHPDQRMRVNATYALGTTGGDASVVVPVLIAAMKDEDVELRLAAVRTLPKFGKAAKPAIPPLIEMLKHQNIQLHHQAAESLVKMSPLSDELTALLAAALKDYYLASHQDTSAFLTEGDEKDHKPNPARGELDLRYDALQQILNATTNREALLPALAEAVKDLSWSLRDEARTALWKIGPPAFPALLDAMNHTSERVRLDAFRILRGIAFRNIRQHGKAIVPALIARLEDPNEQLRRETAEALGRIGSDARTAIPKLTEALNSSSQPFREAVAVALKQINSESAVE